MEPELCIVSALKIHHLSLNDDDTLRMLQMTRGGHLFIHGSEIKGQGQTWTFNLESNSTIFLPRLMIFPTCWQ